MEMGQSGRTSFPLQAETYKVIGIAMEIHRLLGRGLSEIVYKDAFEYEFKAQQIFYQREKEYNVHYKGVVLPHKFFADFIVYDKIVLEIKCKKGIVDEHYAQVINFLAISKLELGLLINFREKSLEYKRIIMNKQ
jgi:GxxExxY protein